MVALERRKRLADGTFGELEKVFGEETSEEKAKRLDAENKLLKAQNNALSDRADFIEDLIQEIAMQVYQ